MNRRDISTLTVLTACERAFVRDDQQRVVDGRMSWEIIQAETGAPEKVVYAAMQREDDRGMIEWGVSLRTAWLSDKGKQKLAELREAVPA